MKDPYKILGVSRNATDEEIRAAYRELAKKYHPDNYVNNPLSDLANEKMKEINEAYDAIMNSRSGMGNNDTYNSYNASGRTDFPEIRELIMQGRVDIAINRLNSIAPGQRNAEWYFLMGSALYKKGWVYEARSNFGTACSLDPTNMEYAAAYNNINRSAQNYGGYRTNGSADSACNCCANLLCADCLCECMGGDLIPCC